MAQITSPNSKKKAQPQKMDSFLLNGLAHLIGLPGSPSLLLNSLIGT